MNESDIREALDKAAYTVEVPEDLASRTLAAASSAEHPGRFATWRESRRMHLPASGYPRWLMAPAAAAAAVLLFAVGSLTINGAPKLEMAKKVESTSLSSQSGTSGSADAVAGSTAGVVSSGSGTVDRAPLRPAAGSPGSNTSGNADFQPQLVRRADIKVAVANFEDGWNEANDIAAAHDGKVFDISTNQATGSQASGTLRIRVPSSELDDTLADLRRLGVMTSLRTTGSDISPSMKILEQQIHDLNVKSKQGGTTSELASIRNKKRNLERQLADHHEQVDTSIITATIVLDEQIAKVSGSLIDKGTDRLGQAVRMAGKVSITILGGGLVLVGALLPLVLFYALFWFGARRWRARRSA